MRQILQTLINMAFDVMYLLVVIRAFLTYLPHNRFHPLIKPAYDATEPLLSMIRKGLPPSTLGFDAAPFIAIVLLYLLQQVFLKVIFLF